MRNLYSDNKIDFFTGENFFLSNFYPCQIPFLGLMYPSVEHAYQASKSLEPEVRESIRNAATPGKAKRLGGKVVVRPDWKEIKLKFMFEFVQYKFHIHELMRSQLLATEEAEIIEGNYWGDTFWGVCGGKGENHLGKIIMKIRDDLRDPTFLYIPSDQLGVIVHL
jgi:ribA/ribD-fused uncharacterized protein